MDDFNERDIWQEKDQYHFIDRVTAMAFGACIGGVFIWLIYTIIHWGGK